MEVDDRSTRQLVWAIHDTVKVSVMLEVVMTSYMAAFGSWQSKRWLEGLEN